jgi:hypothetical protein
MSPQMTAHFTRNGISASFQNLPKSLSCASSSRQSMPIAQINITEGVGTPTSCLPQPLACIMFSGSAGHNAFSPLLWTMLIGVQSRVRSGRAEVVREGFLKKTGQVIVLV